MSDSGSTPTNVVIGAASGMGAEVAAMLAPRGRLVLADRDPERLDEVAGQIRDQLGDTVGPIVSLGCDITVQTEVDALVATIGRLGALVLTAGLSPSMARGRRIYEVNLVGTARVLTALEPVVGAGSVALCFSSMSAYMLPYSAELDVVLDLPESATFFEDLAALIDVDDPQMAYLRSKQGVQRLIQLRAAAWGGRGARLLSLSPGIIDTGMGRLEAANEPSMADMVKASALAREARPTEVAAVAAFLTSDAASFMTGTDVLVDGGAIAAMFGPSR
jgi:NAD(P)-dependent dehydrogenase (short-subunit alcohol dehydrogenase family)